MLQSSVSHRRGRRKGGASSQEFAKGKRLVLPFTSVQLCNVFIRNPLDLTQAQVNEALIAASGKIGALGQTAASPPI